MKKSEVFGYAADFYDALYSDKETSREVDHFLSRAGLPLKDLRGQSVLEIGIGTGRHAHVLAERGCKVLGIDQSEEMLSRIPSHSGITARVADGRSFDLNESFDGVFAFFHVVSYFTSDADLAGLFSSVRKHLKPGAPFVFDTWYTPGVEFHGVETRKREVSTDDYRMTRLSSSQESPDSSIVKVLQQFSVWDSRGNFEREFEETHLMRHFTIDEINVIAKSEGFTVTDVTNSTGSASPTREDWGATFTLMAED